MLSKMPPDGLPLTVRLPILPVGQEGGTPSNVRSRLLIICPLADI